METTIGMRIKQLREAKQMSVADFAKAAGVKPSAIYGLESDANKPSIETVAMLRKSFPNLNTEWLQFGDGSMYKGAELTPAPKPEATAQQQGEAELEPPTPAGGLRKHQPTYEELAAENAYLHKINEELRTDKGHLWQQNSQLIELGKTDTSSDAAAPVDSLAWLTPQPHRQVTGYVRYDQPESTCAHYDMATGLRVEKLQVAKAA